MRLMLQVFFISLDGTCCFGVEVSLGWFAATTSNKCCIYSLRSFLDVIFFLILFLIFIKFHTKLRKKSRTKTKERMDYMKLH